MTTIISQVYDAFEFAGARDDTALAAAGAMADQQWDVAELRGEVTLIEWIVGLHLAFSVAIVLHFERLLTPSVIQPFRTAARAALLACTHTCRAPTRVSPLAALAARPVSRSPPAPVDCGSTEPGHVDAVCPGEGRRFPVAAVRAGPRGP